jgi:hypothetical protein
VANILPSATLVAVRDDATSIESMGDTVVITVTYDPIEDVTDDQRREVLDALRARLDATELASIGEVTGHAGYGR